MKGLIFIPDITGFTNFVRSIDIDTGMYITQNLLNVIMENNSLQMEVSEIEGDAILFYRIGEPIPVYEIVSVFRKMQDAFNKKYTEFKKQFNLEADVSLKLIVHYGDIMLYNINGFSKLFGEAVIEAHRLLKNGSTSEGYVLVTEDYMKALQIKISDFLVPTPPAPSYSSHIIDGIKRIAFQVLPNTKRHLVFES